MGGGGGFLWRLGGGFGYRCVSSSLLAGCRYPLGGGSRGGFAVPIGGVSLAEWSVMVDRYNPVARLQIVVTARYSMLGRALPLEAEALRRWGIKCPGFNSPWSKASGDRGCKGEGVLVLG